MWFPYMNWESAQTLCFTVVNFRRKQIEEQNMAIYHNILARQSATEGDWRIPSSPIVGKKHVDSLYKSKSVLIYIRIAKPFILPLQIFA